MAFVCAGSRSICNHLSIEKKIQLLKKDCRKEHDNMKKKYEIYIDTYQLRFIECKLMTAAIKQTFSV